MINVSKSIRLYAEYDAGVIIKWLITTKHLPIEKSVKYALTRFMARNLNFQENDPSITERKIFASIEEALIKLICINTLTDEIIETEKYITSVAMSIREKN